MSFDVGVLSSLCKCHDKASSSAITLNCEVTVHCTDSLVKRCILIARGLNATPSADHLFYRDAFSLSSEKITGSNPDGSQGHVLWVRRSVHSTPPPHVRHYPIAGVCVSEWAHTCTIGQTSHPPQLYQVALWCCMCFNLKKIGRMSSCVLKRARLCPPLVITVASCCVIGEIVSG